MKGGPARNRAVPGLPHKHPMRYKSIGCSSCLEAANDEELSRVRDGMAERMALRSGGLKSKPRTRKFHDTRHLTSQQRERVEALYQKYLRRAIEQGKDVSTQPKRHPYWLNAVRHGTFDKKRIMLKMARERRTRWEVKFAYRVLVYRKQKQLKPVFLKHKQNPL